MISGPSAISRATNSMSSFRKLRPRCVLLRGHRNFRIVVALMSGSGHLRRLFHFCLMSAPPQNLMRFLRVAALIGTTPTSSNRIGRDYSTGSRPSTRSRRSTHAPSWSATAQSIQTTRRVTSRKRTSRTSCEPTTKPRPLANCTIGYSPSTQTGSIRGRFGAAPMLQKPHAVPRRDDVKQEAD